MPVLPIIQLARNDFSKKGVSLRVPSKEVCDFGEVLQKNIEDLIDTLQNHGISIGLSAPQVGVQLRISVINLSKDKVEPALILINPKIVLISGNKDKKKSSVKSG